MSPPAIISRRAGLADLAVICELAQDLNRMHHQAWPTLFAAPTDPPVDEPHWRESIAGPGRAAFVVEAAGEMQGFVTVSVVDEAHSLLQRMRYGRVNSICIRAEAQGRGLGTRLMAVAEQWARSEGAVDMRLVVWAFNDGALRLYQELGYELRSHAMGKPLAILDGR
ncbi:GNAT family N-acetyltransferase [Paucibacter sp. O1-1]|nr:GNAT family N-acetyltransferase [Paucibacter sp. O1-1]MDA3825932.1 GNAT family N-acetyltransferase [Paucibacter sp. O1-1]